MAVYSDSTLNSRERALTLLLAGQRSTKNMYEKIFLFFFIFKNNFGNKLKSLCPLFPQTCISVDWQCWHVCRLTRRWRRPPCLRRACHRWRTWGTRHAPPPALSRPPRRCPASHGLRRFIHSFHLFF